MPVQHPPERKPCSALCYSPGQENAGRFYKRLSEFNSREKLEMEHLIFCVENKNGVELA